MKFSELSSSSFNGRPGSCSRFPGAAKLPDGDVVMLFDDGVSCESVEHEMRIGFSSDGGISWRDGGLMYDPAALGLPHRFTENCKPTALDGGELISVGFGFERDEPELGLAAYAEKHGRFPLSHNTVSRSRDGGRTWSLPCFIDSGYAAALELSGPALWCEAEKTLLAFGPPFVLRGELQRGVVLASVDRGESWCERGEFFRSPRVAPWEVRSLRGRDGLIWLVLWAFDLVGQRHLNNLIICSDDLGRSWSVPFDTGIRGQAANLFELDGVLHLLYTRREVDDPGIFCVPLRFGGGKIDVGVPTALWRASGMATPSGRIERQFRDLRFGQPSLTPVDGARWLLLYWSCEAGNYAIRSRVLQF